MVLTFDPTANTGTGSKTPLGEYVMTLVSVKLDEEPSQFSDKPRLAWDFRIDAVESVNEDEIPGDVQTDEEYGAWIAAHLVGRIHKEWTNYTMGANSTTRAWLDGMNGKPLDKAVTPADFEGKPYKVTLGNKGYVIQSTGQSGSKRTITAIRPHRKGGFSRAAQAAAPAEAEEAPLF